MRPANALVTGGSRGIGRAIVQRLVQDGYRVLFTFARNDEAAERLRVETEGRAVGIRADAGEPAEIDRLYTAADRYFADQLDRETSDRAPDRPIIEPDIEAAARVDPTGSRPTPYLDLLVNNAGVLGGRGIADETVAEFDRLLAVNVRGFLFTLQRALGRLVDGGRVIAISSMSAAYATPGEASYAASKAAVERIVSVAAKELGTRGITVNAVAPGPVDTEPLRATLPAEALDGTAAFTPLGRLGAPTDIASVVSFLAGPDGGWISGQSIGANGGLA